MNMHVAEYYYHLMCEHECKGDMETAFECLKMMNKEL